MKNYFPTEITAMPSNGTIKYSTTNLPAPVKAIRYFLPLEIHVSGSHSGLYHYGCYTFPANELSPVGYCAQGCPGHDTAEQAREHYRQFLIDRFGRFNGRLAIPSICCVCGQTATHYAWIDFHYAWDAYGLCALHLNRKGLAQVFVLTDYHLLQISDPRDERVATMNEHGEAVSIVGPATQLDWAKLDEPRV
jgi:hypothetical protein